MHAPPRAGVRAPRGRVSGMDGPSAARGRPGPPEGAPVSIIVPTWNEAKCLPALLDSLRAQTRWGYPHNAWFCFFFRRSAFEALGGVRDEMLLNETHDIALRSRTLGRFVILPQRVQTSMRRFRTYGYLRTILKEYIASTILFYATGRTPSDRFRPQPAR